MPDEQTLLLAAAFNSVGDVLKSIHSEFKAMAIAVVLLMVFTITAATMFVWHVTANSEQQMLKAFSGLAEKLQIHQSQNVNIEKSTSREDVIREDMIRQQNKLEKQ